MIDSKHVVELPLCVQVNGRQWKLFTFEFATPDGKFCSYLYAISPEHAAALLSEMKEHAVLKGEMVSANGE